MPPAVAQHPRVAEQRVPLVVAPEQHAVAAEEHDLASRFVERHSRERPRRRAADGDRRPQLPVAIPGPGVLPNARRVGAPKEDDAAARPVVRHRVSIADPRDVGSKTVGSGARRGTEQAGGDARE